MEYLLVMMTVEYIDSLIYFSIILRAKLKRKKSKLRLYDDLKKKM